jgi:hypothetical protein
VAGKPGQAAGKTGWFTTQLRVRKDTHDYLTAQARESGISITQAAGVILDYACRQGWQIGPVTVTRQPSAVVTRPDPGEPP